MRSKRFKPLVNLAQQNEREAARALGQALQALNEKIDQLKQLTLYKIEYSQRLMEIGNIGISATKLNEFRQFIDNIDAAIKAQHESIDRARNTLEEKKQFWFSRRGRSKALDNVLDRYLEDEKKQSEKREQREVDDRATHSSNSSD